jgi:hypothetical protein
MPIPFTKARYFKGLEYGTIMDLTVTLIGNIDADGGKDTYLRLERLDDILTIDQAREYIAERFYIESSQPGGYFCNSSSIVHQQHSDSVVIATVHQRYDN